MGEGDRGGGGAGNPVLRFFGLHTAAQAGETLLWVAPYLGVFVAALVGLSLLVQRVFPLPLWVHGVAVVVAGGNCFLFLARIRRSALEEEATDRDAAPDRPSDVSPGDSIEE